MIILICAMLVGKGLFKIDCDSEYSNVVFRVLYAPRSVDCLGATFWSGQHRT